MKLTSTFVTINPKTCVITYSTRASRIADTANNSVIIQFCIHVHYKPWRWVSCPGWSASFNLRRWKLFNLIFWVWRFLVIDTRFLWVIWFTIIHTRWVFWYKFVFWLRYVTKLKQSWLFFLLFLANLTDRLRSDSCFLFSFSFFFISSSNSIFWYSFDVSTLQLVIRFVHTFRTAAPGGGVVRISWSSSGT